MSDETYDVIVAGAGPVGLIASLILARSGARVALIEKRETISTASRASTLHPPTLELLDSLGVLQEVQHLGAIADRIQHRVKDDVVAEFDIGDLSSETRFPYRLHLEQSKVTPVMLEKLLAHPAADVRFETEVVGVAQDADGVTATVRKRDTESRIRARYMLAADGSRSSVRTMLGIDFPGKEYPGRVLRLMLRDRPEDIVPGISPVAYVHNGDRSISFLKMPDCWRMVLRVGDVEDESVITDDWILEKIRIVMPNVSQVPPLVDRDFYSVSCKTASAFRNGRVYLAGDAAHITSTRGGMNMNCGVHDGATMGHALVKALAANDQSIADAASDLRRAIAASMLLPRTDRSSKAGGDWIELMRTTAADKKKARAYLQNTAMLDMVDRAYCAG